MPNFGTGCRYLQTVPCHELLIFFQMSTDDFDNLDLSYPLNCLKIESKNWGHINHPMSRRNPEDMPDPQGKPVRTTFVDKNSYV